MARKPVGISSAADAVVAVAAGSSTLLARPNSEDALPRAHRRTAILAIVIERNRVTFRHVVIFLADATYKVVSATRLVIVQVVMIVHVVADAMDNKVVIKPCAVISQLGDIATTASDAGLRTGALLVALLAALLVARHAAPQPSAGKARKATVRADGTDLRVGSVALRGGSAVANRVVTLGG